MSRLEALLGPMPLQQFREKYFERELLAVPGAAREYRRLLTWERLAGIFTSGHRDCWLADRGRLASKGGTLTLEEAQRGFATGQTVVVRHSERADSALGEIAADFQRLFQRPVDIQLYVTPPGQEGFDWHYDVEDVFVIQSSGAKEFYLRKNRVTPAPWPMIFPKTLAELDRECAGPEMRCLLQAGDWLYIPAGTWHKARAMASSFHLSVGVLTRDIPPTH